MSVTMPRMALAAGLSGALACLGVLGVGHSSAAPQGNALGELMFGGLYRTTWFMLRSSNDHSANLVINPHGSGASGGAQAAITNYDPVADALGFRRGVPRRFNASLGSAQFFAAHGR